MIPIPPGFTEKVATTLVTAMVKGSAAWLRKKLAAGETAKALEAAVAEALERALAAQVIADEALAGHYLDLLKMFFAREAVGEELARLLDPSPDAALDLEVLRAELDATGFDRDPEHLPGFDLEAFLLAFARAFWVAAGKQPVLQGALQLQLLGSIHIGIARVGDDTARIAEAAERGAAAEEKNTELLAAIHGSLVENQQGVLLTAIRAEVQQGFLSAVRGFEFFLAELRRAGYTLEISRAGEVLLPEGKGDKLLAPGPRGEVLEAATELRQAITGSTPTATELDELEAHYRRHLVDWFKNLEFRGLQAGTPVSLPLEEVYVELRAVAEVPEAADSFSVDERRLLLEIEEGDEEKRRELTRQLDGLRKERWSRTLPERQSIAQALHHRDRRTFVILGDPGSGKTTLLHFLALVYARGAEKAAERLKLNPTEADRLPIFAPLAAFDDMLREAKESGERRLPLWEFLSAYYDRRRNLPGLAPLFRRALESGKALVLLDGLDEVIDVGTRGYVAEQVAVLAGEWAPRGVRFALSSRFVGYREAAVPGSPTTLSVLDFGLPEIRVFLHQWAQVYERTVAGAESPETLKKAQELERGLLSDVESNDSVRRLAANPLMLTMLALLRRQVGKLPHKRVLLYEAYLSTLLDSWIAARSLGARDQSLVVMDRNQAENLLMPLALWLQTEKPSGTAGKFEMREKLVEICLKDEGFSAERTETPEWQKARKKGEAHADRFLKEIREMTGLLVERGHDAYGFLHLTFQEYFAGRELARKDDDTRWRALRPYLHDPRWREPILLCAGRLGIVEARRPQVSKIVRNVLDCDDLTEGDLHRNLLLALAIAGDDVGIDKEVLETLVSQAVDLVPATNVYVLAKSLLEGLGRLVANGQVDLERAVGGALGAENWLATLAVEILRQVGYLPAARQRLMELRGSGNPRLASAAGVALKSLVKEHNDLLDILLTTKDRRKTLDIISSRVATDPEVFRLMVEALAQRDSNWRTVAVSALGPLADSRREVREALLPLLKDPDYWVRKVTLASLSASIPKDTAVRDGVIEGLDDQVSDVRDAATLALGPWVNSDPLVWKALLAVARDPQKSSRAIALEAIGATHPIDDQTRQAVLLGLEVADASVAIAAVKTVARWVQILPEFRIVLLGHIQATYADERNEALLGLVQAFPADPQVNAAVRELAEHRSRFTRETVARLLGDRDGASNVVISDIQERQATFEFAATVSQGLESLGLLVAASVKIHQMLLWLLEGELSEFRVAAVQALGSRAAEQSGIREAIVARLDNRHTREDVRLESVKVLAPLAGDYSEVREAIGRELANPDANKAMIRASITALAPLAANDFEIREAILGKLIDSDNDVRATSLEALAPLAGHHPKIRDAILGNLVDPGASESVRFASIRALGPQAVHRVEIRDAILAKIDDLDNGVVSISMEALGPLATESKIREAILSKFADPSWIVRRSALRALGPMATSLPEIREAILNKLDDPDNDVRAAAVVALAPMAGEVPKIREAILSLFADLLPNVRRAAAQALGPLVTESREIREAIFRNFVGHNNKMTDAVIMALGNQAAVDLEIREAILSKIGDPVDAVGLAAVTELGALVTNQPEIREAIHSRLRDSDWELREPVWGALLDVVPESPRLANTAADWLHRGKSFEIRFTGLQSLLTLEEKALLGEEHWAGLEVWLNCDANPESQNVRQTRKRLAQAIAKGLPERPKLQHQIRKLLKSPRASARLGGILTLAAWPGGPPEEVIDEILEALQDDRDFASYPARLTATFYLINDGHYDERSIALCLEALDYGTQPWENLRDSPAVRKQAALVLSKLEPVRFHDRAYTKLLEVMKKDEDAEVRDAAYNALVRLARAGEVAGAALFRPAIKPEDAISPPTSRIAPASGAT